MDKLAPGLTKEQLRAAKIGLYPLTMEVRPALEVIPARPDGTGAGLGISLGNA